MADYIDTIPAEAWPTMNILQEALGAYNLKPEDTGEPVSPEAAATLLFRQLFPGKKQGDFTTEDLERLPDDLRVELIDGVIYLMYSPSSFHQTLAGAFYSQLLSYVVEHDSPCFPHIAWDMRPDTDNRSAMQPDIMIVADDSDAVTTQKCLIGSPALAVEILSPSTRKKDLTIKLKKYMEIGVWEYWIIDIDREQVIVYSFRGRSDHEISLYSFQDKIPVGICRAADDQSAEGCVIDFPKIADILTILKKKMPGKDSTCE
ncbi:MAG: Uma2 family endonuclease [Eubacterium sp.]|nr:Uma2 family endonuclease [Eubacterium sp.]